MGFLNQRAPGQARYSGEMHNLQLTESVYGTVAPLVFGTCRVHAKLLFCGGFNATPAPNTGGSGIFRGKSTQFLYWADALMLLAQCGQSRQCQTLLNVWNQNGKLTNSDSVSAFTVPPGGGVFTAPTNPPPQCDLGVFSYGSYTVTVSNYGAGGSQTFTGTQAIIFKRVGTPTTATEYSYNPLTGSWTFPAAAAGKVYINWSAVFSLSFHLTT